jgi:hypothetical protein
MALPPACEKQNSLKGAADTTPLNGNHGSLALLIILYSYTHCFHFFNPPRFGCNGGNRGSPEGGSWQLAIGNWQLAIGNW